MLRFSHATRVPEADPLRLGEDEGGRSSERGVIMALTAVGLVAVMMMAMLVVSGSLAYSQRRNAQNAADASASAGARALDHAMFFGGPLTGVQDTVASLVADHGAQRFECWLTYGDASRMTYPATGNDVPCTDTATIGYWRNYLSNNRPTQSQPAGVDVVVYDDKPTLFGGLNGTDETVSAVGGAKATVQMVLEVGAPWVICVNPAYAGERGGLDDPVDLLMTTADGPDADDLPDFVFNPDGTVDVDPVKAADANKLNRGQGIGLDGSKVAECGAGANFDGKGVPNLKFRLPGVAQVQQGTGYSTVIQDQVASTNPCPTPLPVVLDGCEILLPLGISGSNMEIQIVSAGVFSVTGNGNGKYGYYGKYMGKAQYVVGVHSTSIPVSTSSLRVIRLVA